MLKSVIVVLTAGSLALAGCASSSNSKFSSSASSQSAYLTPDQKVLRANAERVDPENAGDGTVTEAVVIGAVALGVLGCGIALLAGGNGGDCAAAGAAGAAVGAAGGYLAGSWVQDEQRDYASREDYLYDVIDAADTEIAENRRAADAARRVTAYHQEQLALLQAQYDAKKVSKSEYREAVEQAGVDRDAIAYAVQHNRQRIAELDQLIAEGASPSQLAMLQERRQALAQENAELQAQLEEMVALLSTAPSSVKA